MTGDFPAVSGKKIVKALEAEGWYVKRVRGSHHITVGLSRADLKRLLDG